jgi:RNA polymerase sigma-70 factor (ECF subfamily)
VDEAAEREAGLVAKARKGDDAAFLALFVAHRTAVLRFAWRMTGSVDASEDVAQDCFLLLMKSADFDPRRGSLRTWLFGIARNLVFRRLRVTGRETDEPEELPDRSDPLQDLLAGERAEAVQRAIGRLPPLQREAIVLFEYEEMSLESIASVTGAEVGAVKARLQRARESLRRQLAPVLSRRPERSFL